MPASVFSAVSTLTATQVAKIVDDVDNRGESLGFINPSLPANSSKVSQNANDYFFNIADGNAMYRSTAAGQAVTAFTKFDIVGGTVIGEGATFATLPAVVNGKYALLTANDVGTGTALNPQYRRGVFKGVGGVWVAQLPSGGDAVASETVVLASLPADAWTNVPTGLSVTAPVYIDIKDSTDRYIDLDRRMSGGAWQIISSVPLTNVKIVLWS